MAKLRDWRRRGGDQVILREESNVSVGVDHSEEITELWMGIAAIYALTIREAETGDYRWHGGQKDFKWPDETGEAVKMDAETFMAFALDKITRG